MRLSVLVSRVVACIRAVSEIEKALMLNDDRSVPSSLGSKLSSSFHD